jgi:ABC-type oligopeptide transport system ATPase subunit
MYRGSLVDLFETNEAENAERHSYTRALLDAVPVPAGTESSPSP